MQPQQPNQDRVNQDQQRKTPNQEDYKANVSPKRPSSDDSRKEATEGSKGSSATPNEFPEFQNQPTPDSDVQLRGNTDRKSQFKAPEDTI